VSPKAGVWDRCTCGLAKDGRVDAYNEEAFRYLLRLERRRSERSRRPFLLILVDLQNEPEGDYTPPPGPDRLFASLCRALRESDVVGWYREERIAGAVLTGQGDPSWIDVAARITGRVTDALSQALPLPASRRLQVRAHQIHPTLAQ
jgi:hypothetical protein